MKNKYLMMGWPYGCPPSTQLPYQNDYDMLSIENSIREILINNKCDFTYKLHPDRSDETLELYKNIIDKFEHTKFEKIYNNYDTIIFSYPHTTTFFYALDKAKNIIFFDNEDENYLEKEAYLYIQQKTKIVKYKRLMKNKFQFDSITIN
jgi:hypothetical protein